MLNGTLPIFKSQENLDLIRGIPVEILIGSLVLFVLGQILRSIAIFSLDRGINSNRLIYSFIPFLRLPAYLQILIDINPTQFSVFGRKLPIPIIALLIQVALIATALLTTNFSLFMFSFSGLLFLDLIARKALMKIGERTQVNPNPLWWFPLLGSFLVLFRKQKQLIIAM